MDNKDCSSCVNNHIAEHTQNRLKINELCKFKAQHESDMKKAYVLLVSNLVGIIVTLIVTFTFMLMK